MITIILTLISLIIYDIGKKGIKILLIKWNKKKIDMIIQGVGKKMKIDDEGQEYWGSKWI